MTDPVGAFFHWTPIQCLTLSAFTPKEQRPLAIKPWEQSIYQHSNCPSSSRTIAQPHHLSPWCSQQQLWPPRMTPVWGRWRCESHAPSWTSYSKVGLCSMFCLAVLANWIIPKKGIIPETANIFQGWCTNIKCGWESWADVKDQQKPLLIASQLHG